MTTHEADQPDQPDGDQQVQDDRVAELEARIAELEDRWRGTLADFDNFRKRTTRETDQRRDFERARAAGAWLPVLDNLDMALEHAQADPSTIVEGVHAVRAQADAVMARLGFPRRADDAGAPFDPLVHEAVSTMAVPGIAPGTIVQVVRSGYGDEDHQLRPTAVVVATGSD
jgi:molecular chaperone GrpE